jgi:ATP-dependent protease HslVU (ClpYQ) peptidase subunit
MSLVIVDPLAKTIAADFRLSEGMCRGNNVHKVREFKDEGVIIAVVGGLRDFTVACQFMSGVDRDGAQGENLAWSLSEHLVEHGDKDADNSGHIVLIDTQDGTAWYIEDTRAVVPIEATMACGHGKMAAYALLDAGFGLKDVYHFVAMRDNTVSEEYELIRW